MKLKSKMTGFFILACLIGAPLISKSPSEKKHDLESRIKIKLLGFRNNKGQALIGLVDEKGKTKFPGSGQNLLYKTQGKIENGIATFVLINVKYGTYALQAFHDENSNFEFDKSSFMNLPKEGYGFSNNVEGERSAPSFDQAKFIIDKPEMEMEIIIRYLL